MTTLPSTTWRMLAQRSVGDQKLPEGIDAAWDSAAGLVRRFLTSRAAYLKRAKKIIAIRDGLADLPDGALRKEALRLKETFRLGKDTRADLDRGFAVAGEVAHRTLGQRPFQVQVAGALALHDGCIVEMATGEGKTLTATMPATVAGWRGRGCHVVTVNDYLARRDAEWMATLYNFCDVSVAHVEQEMEPNERMKSYRADITYCTNKEVSADFLRDRLALGRTHSLSQALLTKLAEGQGSGTDSLIQRGLNYAIVDEADSILVDEAVTPLIISGEAPNPEQTEAFKQAAALAGALQPATHYKINRRYKEIDLTRSGRRELERLTEDLDGVWKGMRRAEELVVQALTAKEFYTLNDQYVIQEDEVVIVDEFTGRLMPDREWRDGLHQAVSAKEDVPVKSPKDTYARISFQRFFRLYRKLSGMTGTAREARSEFWQIYHLPAVIIPTNRPCIRTVSPDRVFATEDAKWQAIVDEIHRVHETGRPILVGTRSVHSSQHLSELLAAEGLEHQVLNAIFHEQEAQIVAEAGRPGRITVATNMAGRGTDIQLGRGMAELGGLHVIATERHASGRVDRQLFGRCARQGDPGSAVAFVSLEDELPQRYSPRATAVLKKRFGQTDREISSRVTRKLFDKDQRKAEKLALAQRKSVLKTDTWLDEYLGFAGKET